MFCLRVPSDAAWVDHAVRDLDLVLVDHAHCEMKAASNALALAARHPANLEVVRALTALAAEEIEHFRRVLSILEARRLPLGTPPPDTYAADLRRGVSRLPPALGPLVDRLLVGALIEARSCERFKLLATALQSCEPELAAFYEELFISEARHYAHFVELAGCASGGSRARVQERLFRVAEVEAELVRGLATRTARSSVHG